MKIIKKNSKIIKEKTTNVFDVQFLYINPTGYTFLFTYLRTVSKTYLITDSKTDLIQTQRQT